jgi:hypothetical protein
MKRTALTSNPETTRAWQARSRETARERVMETPRGAMPAKRKGGQRRVVHPFPLPTPGERITEADVRTELHAFGPQAELCRKTMCAACFAVGQWRMSSWGGPVDWSRLPSFAVRTSVAHHEPRRGLKGEALDRDCMPLCPAHHTEGNGDTVRHRLRSDARDAATFYALLPFDWRAVVAEMRRRVALNTIHPVVDTTASEKNPWPNYRKAGG